MQRIYKAARKCGYLQGLIEPLEPREAKKVAKNKILDDKILVEESNMLECFDLMRSESNFNLRVRGIKVIIHDVANKKTLNINCINKKINPDKIIK